MKALTPHWHQGLILGPALGLVLLALSYVRTVRDAFQSMMSSSQLFPLLR